MLKHLRIENIILVEKAELSFNPGLNILTGETGSGKSAIMRAIKLITGERAELNILRKGSEKGVVEAIFEFEDPSILNVMQEGGIEHDSDQELIIRREIFSSGKGRVFINNQLAQLSFLRKLGAFLVLFVNQHANQRLLSLDYHRHVIDLYGEIAPQLTLYRKSFEEENILRKKVIGHTEKESQRLREIDRYQKEVDELDAAQIKEGEDEELFLEYTLLVNSEEVASSVHEIIQALSGDKQSILLTLNKQKHHLENLLNFDPTLKDTIDAFQNAFIELQEVSYTFKKYKNTLHANPDRLLAVNNRLTLLNRLKRKYGPTTQDTLKYLEEAKEKLTKLISADFEIDVLKDQLLKCEENTNLLAQQLTEIRKIIANKLENELTNELRSLNMSKAIFNILITSQIRNLDGDDSVEFFLSPNVGENKISLRESASGGELSRVLLAIQKLLAGKEQTKTLVLDEIDGNIGGKTATIVGDKLQKIAKQHQVICITHFPQVAIQADYHLQIHKEEINGRTLTHFKELDACSRKAELARMAGLKARPKIIENEECLNQH